MIYDHRFRVYPTLLGVSAFVRLFIYRERKEPGVRMGTWVRVPTVCVGILPPTPTAYRLRFQFSCAVWVGVVGVGVGSVLLH